MFLTQRRSFFLYSFVIVDIFLLLCNNLLSLTKIEDNEHK